MTYWDNITEMYEKQKQKGLKSYGMTLEDNHTLTLIDTITMTQEELIDTLLYLEKSKELLRYEYHERTKRFD